MQTFRLRVDEDGRVEIPDTQPGETVTVQVSRTSATRVPQTLTLATARTEDERAAVKAEITRLARELRHELNLGDTALSRSHGDELYDDRGLPT